MNLKRLWNHHLAAGGTRSPHGDAYLMAVNCEERPFDTHVRVAGNAA